MSLDVARAREAVRARAWEAAAGVLDPEVPCVTVEDLGILVDVSVERANGDWVATAEVTPTYSGCPAVAEIERMVGEALAGAGFEPRVKRVLHPAWTTDRITADGHAKLRAFGIAPPACTVQPNGAMRGPATVTFFSRTEPACPRCGSSRTELLSEFGSTACKAHHRCLECREPFDHFKPL